METKTKAKKASAEMNLKEILGLVREFKLDYLKVGDLEIRKSIHSEAIASKPMTVDEMKRQEEEDLFYSSTPGKMTL